MNTKTHKIDAANLPGEILRIKRTALELSRAQLADLIGVEARTLWRWETGSGKAGAGGWPKPSTFAELVRKIDVLMKRRRCSRRISLTLV